MRPRVTAILLAIALAVAPCVARAQCDEAPQRPARDPFTRVLSTARKHGPASRTPAQSTVARSAAPRAIVVANRGPAGSLKPGSGMARASATSVSRRAAPAKSRPRAAHVASTRPARRAAPLRACVPRRTLARSAGGDVATVLTSALALPFEEMAVAQPAPVVAPIDTTAADSSSTPIVPLILGSSNIGVMRGVAAGIVVGATLWVTHGHEHGQPSEPGTDGPTGGAVSGQPAPPPAGQTPPVETPGGSSPGGNGGSGSEPSTPPVGGGSAPPATTPPSTPIGGSTGGQPDGDPGDVDVPGGNDPFVPSGGPGGPGGRPVGDPGPTDPGPIPGLPFPLIPTTDPSPDPAGGRPGSDQSQVGATAVPEPAAATLLGVGMLLLVGGLSARARRGGRTDATR